jgi:hypothetical protein
MNLMVRNLAENIHLQKRFGCDMTRKEIRYVPVISQKYNINLSSARNTTSTAVLML